MGKLLNKCATKQKERESSTQHILLVLLSRSLALKIKVILTVSIRFKLFDLLSEFD